MTTIRVFQVDAFAEKVFEGNPAAVCPLDEWLSDDVMQAVAAENNLSETAFLVRTETGRYGLRWFTPAAEVDLCGHATLASAHVILEMLGETRAPDGALHFDTRSGVLSVRPDGARLSMDFPALAATPAPVPDGLSDALCVPVEALFTSRDDWMAVLSDADSVRGLAPDMKALAAFPFRGLIATAPGNGGDQFDFVSRFFAPAFGIDEDPVTGSAHCVLAPYWADRTGRTQLVGRQVSRRGGTVYCEVAAETGRVTLAGSAVPFMEGEIRL